MVTNAIKKPSDPKQEYKREALVEIKHKAICIISHVQVQQEDRTG